MRGQMGCAVIRLRPHAEVSWRRARMIVFNTGPIQVFGESMSSLAEHIYLLYSKVKLSNGTI